jgi:hypothetical protein
MMIITSWQQPAARGQQQVRPPCDKPHLVRSRHYCACCQGRCSMQHEKHCVTARSRSYNCSCSTRGPCRNSLERVHACSGAACKC